MTDRAAILIHELELEPHPEGGHYREIFRSPHAVHPQDGRELRSGLTSIYYLLRNGERSRWHRVASDEAWHFYEGDAVELWVAAPDGSAFTRVSLGPAAVDTAPTYVVPARWWQAARTEGSYALAGCTVGPGFDVRDFALLADDAASLELLRGRWPEIGEML
ncbi:MAG TPA: cupin domain-containing protein [Gemmatimonadaceae bacterium]|nr:cupin domain-containing protein [Gemmatimonadaceae bacterium]